MRHCEAEVPTEEDGEGKLEAGGVVGFNAPDAVDHHTNLQGGGQRPGQTVLDQMAAQTEEEPPVERGTLEPPDRGFHPLEQLGSTLKVDEGIDRNPWGRRRD